MKKNKRYIIIGLLVSFIIAVLIGIDLYQRIYSPNVTIQDKEATYFYIPTGATYNDVIDSLRSNNIIDDIESFKWVAEKKNYDKFVQSGRYNIKNHMSNNQLVTMLRAGRQEPIDLIFNNIRTKEQLASRVAEQIEADSSSIVQLLNNDAFLKQFGFNSQTVYAMIIPNTYEFWWNTPAKEFITRMHKEYEAFWTANKKKKAEKLNFTPTEVSTLASIVDEETLRNEEMPKISGVYINRLKKGMRLQADPTIKFAINDFSVKRVLSKHLEVDSPYNTYKYRGLPPGPISFPSIKAINSVLNYQDHEYLYFCAKPDFSGYHNFSKTHYQHINNARKYQRALNKEKIWE